MVDVNNFIPLNELLMEPQLDKHISIFKSQELFMKDVLNEKCLVL